MTKLEEYYNKFNEDKRLNSRHGRIEFQLTMEVLQEEIKRLEQEEPDEKREAQSYQGTGCGICIADIGAATGAYTIPLAQMGCQVTAVELVQHNLGRLKQKVSELGLDGVTAIKGNAVNLKKLESDQYDITLLFGPMYHLTDFEDRLAALKEAKRITRPGGKIYVAYVMNEYAILSRGILEGKLKSEMAAGRIDGDFHTQPIGDDFYYYARLEDMDRLNAAAGLKRVDLFSPDGQANLLRRQMNALTEEDFDLFIDYQRTVMRRPDLIGAGGHSVDVLTKRRQI